MSEKTKVQGGATEQGRAKAHTSASASGRSVANPILGFQQTLGNQAMRQLLEGGAIQAKLRVSQPGDPDEQEADRIAERVVSASHAPKIRRKCACAGGPPCAKCASEDEETIHRSAAGPLFRVPELSIQRAPAEQSATPEEPPAKTGPHHHATHPLVIEDDAEKIEPQQMRKSQFLALLRTDACATADAVLMSVGKSTKGCPYIEKWLAHYEKQSSPHIEAAMRKYAPETARARSAREAIRLLLVRVQKAALSWAKTGKVDDLPPEMAGEITGQKSLLDKVHDFATTGVAGAIFGFIGGKGKSQDSGAGGVMRKAQSVEPAPAHDAAAVKSQLGSGHSLDSRVQSQMSSAFGHDFSGVRVHTDSGAAKLSSDLEARAFTIGNDVAFASGEYRPGTLIGDALIAHELAHVVQQSSGETVPTPQRKSDGDDSALERDADRSAVGAVTYLWGKSDSDGSPTLSRPCRSSGLRLSRCSKDKGAAATLGHRTTAGPTEKGCGGYEWSTQWSLSGATADTNGFVVQKVVFDQKREKCDRTRDDFAKTYWEGWQVRQGVIYIGTSDQRHNADTFAAGSRPGEKGTNIEEGYAKYIDGYLAPSSWGNVPEARSLPSTTNEPKDWSDAGAYHRKIKNEFDCCNPGSPANFSTEE